MFYSLNVFLFNKRFIEIIASDSHVGEALLTVLQSIKHFIDLKSILMVFQEFDYPISRWLHVIQNDSNSGYNGFGGYALTTLTNFDSNYSTSTINSNDLQRENDKLTLKMAQKDEETRRLKEYIDNLIHSCKNNFGNVCK